MNPHRVRELRPGPETAGPVVYWMSRDQRAEDNWALLYAQDQARARKSPVGVVFCLVPEFLGAGVRQYGFMLRGLKETQARLAKKGIPFFLLTGNPGEAIPRFLKKHRVGLLVTDFDPLRIKREWKDAVGKEIQIPFHEVDAHNIVPVWIASPKQEFGAYTLRPKLHRLLPEYLDEFPKPARQTVPWPTAAKPDWDRAEKTVRADRSVPEVDWLVPGSDAGRKTLKAFIRDKLSSYPQNRNDPNQDGQSNLSPYLHFGQIAPQRAALDVMNAGVPIAAREAFLEELIVRRELSDNFCFYNPVYDSVEGFPAWARTTLNAHRRDRREFLFDLETLEQGRTHDPLWNAAQRQLVRTGKMHGYLRMYWGKKILEWTPSPDQALDYSIRLNDKYELDGRDPNGYVGIAWSIGGLHDRPWKERPVFGMIRYMSYSGAKSKFDVKALIDRYA